MENVDREMIHKIIYSDNKHVQENFRQEFRSEIDEIVDELQRSYARFEELAPRAPKRRRAAWVQAFLYTAFQSILASTHLLVSGYLMQSGNAMRQFAEALSMALLCSHPAIDVFERFIEAPRQFSTNKAVTWINRTRNRELLDVNQEGWERFEEISASYDEHSHASALAVANLLMLEHEDGLVFGSEYDPGKRDAYEVEVTRRRTAIDRFYETVVRIEQILVNET